MTENLWPSEDGVAVELETVENVYRGFLAVDHYSLHVPRFDGGKRVVKRALLERGSSVCILPYDPRRIVCCSFASFLSARRRRPSAATVTDHLRHTRGEQRQRGYHPPRGDEGRGVRGASHRSGAGLPRIAWRLSERVVAYIGEADLSANGPRDPQAEEKDIKIEIFDAAAAIALLDESLIESAPAVILLSWLARHRERVRREWI